MVYERACRLSGRYKGLGDGVMKPNRRNHAVPRRRRQRWADRQFGRLQGNGRWVAQITADGTKDKDAVFRMVLEPLGTTEDPEGYMPFIRRHAPTS